MSVIGSNILAGASGQGGGYNLTRSLRFRSSASAYLNRTPAVSGNQNKWTWSAWIKRGSLGIYGQLFSARNSDNNNFGLLFWNDDTLYFADQTVPTYNLQFKTTQVFRDPSAWYHVVLAIDTTQATNTNRVKLYVNGSQVTAFSTATYPSQNLNTYVNTTNPHNISAFTANSNHFDGYLTEVNFIDGQALTPSSFGQTSTTTGVWQPKRYTGTYGTNGFYLPFTDNSTTTTLGNDFSGNGNNWTTNNISLTAGATYDSMTDVPTLTSATASNFATWNPLDKSSAVSVSNGNLVATNTNVSERAIKGTMQIPSSGKWYFEVIPSGSSQGYFGIASSSAPLDPTSGGSVVGAQSYGWNENGRFYVNGSFSTTPFPTWTSGDVLAIAIDTTANTILFYKNGVAVSAGAQSIDGNYTYFPFAVLYNITWTVNFGQRPFAYTPPTGFVALNTFNLPTPSIGATASTQANKYMDVALYTGNAPSSVTVTGLNFQPDLVWLKSRTYGYDHVLTDAVRGVEKGLASNATYAEFSPSGNPQLTAFNSNGFTVGNNDSVNRSGAAQLGWAWKANGTGVSNTAGSITSTVSANTTSGFSVVTYSGQASNGTVGHGLGVAPKMIIVKNRTTGSTGWVTYHASLPSPSVSILYLNQTSAVVTGVGTWTSTAPTSTVFSVEGGDSQVNAGSNNYVAYCFSEVAGYSKFGSYTGNGSADGTFVATGFTPRFIMVKRTNAIGNWILHDTARDTSNLGTRMLFPNTSDAEDATGAFDILSNGFKARSTSASWNGSGDTYIYMAFASVPQKFSLGR